jgi:hypothetical protein
MMMWFLPGPIVCQHGRKTVTGSWCGRGGAGILQGRCALAVAGARQNQKQVSEGFHA